MADIRKLVSIDAAGTVTVIKDLEVAGSYQAVRDSFQVKAPDRQTSWSGPSRRYAGRVAVNEAHENAVISWKVLVSGATADACLQNIEAMVAQIEPLYSPGLFIEWRPDGATNSTYFDVRGPAKWQTEYSWAQFTGARSMLVSVEVPVAPLARGATSTQSVSSFTAPNVVQLPTAIPGTAPAQVSVTVNKASGGQGPAFALLAWWPRLPTPPGGYQPIFTIMEAESGTSLSGWATGSDATARGGSKLTKNTSGAGTASATFKVHTGGISAPTVDVEVWARIYLATSVVAPRVVVSMTTDGATGSVLRTSEWGSLGRPLPVPSAAGWRLVRLGTITVPVTNVSGQWKMTLDGVWGAGSFGLFDVDWLMMVPAATRACSPGGEPLDAAYPRFMPIGTGTMAKRVSWDLTGAGLTSGVYAPDTGLGGAAIEMQPGTIDMAVLLSDQVADEPTSGNAMSKEWTSTTLDLTVVSRYWLARA